MRECEGDIFRPHMGNRRAQRMRQALDDLTPGAPRWDNLPPYIPPPAGNAPSNGTWPSHTPNRVLECPGPPVTGCAMIPGHGEPARPVSTEAPPTSPT